MPKGSEKGVVKNKTLNVSKDTLHKRSKALGFGGWPHRRYRKLGDDEDVNESDSEGDDYDDGGSVCMGTVKVQVMQNGWKELRSPEGTTYYYKEGIPSSQLEPPGPVADMKPNPTFM